MGLRVSIPSQFPGDAFAGRGAAPVGNRRHGVQGLGEVTPWALPLVLPSVNLHKGLFPQSEPVSRYTFLGPYFALNIASY